MAFPQSAFPKLRAILDETVARVRALETECAATDGKAETVYHVTVLATPVAGTPASKARKRL